MLDLVVTNFSIQYMQFTPYCNMLIDYVGNLDQYMHQMRLKKFYINEQRKQSKLTSQKACKLIIVDTWFNMVA